jgi:hypothetical protein
MSSKSSEGEGDQVELSSLEERERLLGSTVREDERVSKGSELGDRKLSKR